MDSIRSPCLETSYLITDVALVCQMQSKQVIHFIFSVRKLYLRAAQPERSLLILAVHHLVVYWTGKLCVAGNILFLPLLVVVDLKVFVPGRIFPPTYGSAFGPHLGIVQCVYRHLHPRWLLCRLTLRIALICLGNTIVVLFVFQGFMEETLLFIGYYDNAATTVQSDSIYFYYNIPLAYILVAFAYFFLSLFLLVRR